MIEPFFRTIIEYDMRPEDGYVKEDDKISLQSNGEYVRIAISDPSLCRQIRIIQIPIELLLVGFKPVESEYTPVCGYMDKDELRFIEQNDDMIRITGASGL